MLHYQIKLRWVGRVGKAGVGHSYRNKAKGWTSLCDGYLWTKSKRRSRVNSFACQAHLCMVCRLWGRGWVSLPRFTGLCHVGMWGLPQHIYLGSFPPLLGLKSTLCSEQGFPLRPNIFVSLSEGDNQHIQTTIEKSRFNYKLSGHMRASPFFYP